MTESIWDHYHLTIEAENIAGGLPVDPRLVDAWQQAHWSKVAKLLPEDPKTPEEAAERTRELLPVTGAEAGWTTFARDGEYLAIEGRQVKAMLKESANIMKSLLPVNGKQIPLRARLAEQVFPVERLIRLQPDRTEADTVAERPIHVMTAQGPRDALKRSDICVNVTMACTLRVLRGGIFTHKLLCSILDHASENGIGADRSQGYGKFTYVLT